MAPALDIPADLQLAGCISRVIAVIRPFRIDEVMGRLVGLAPCNVAVELVRGYGRQKDHLALYDEQQGERLFLPKVRIEFTIPGERLREAVQAIRQGALTGRIGDGKIFIQAIEAIAPRPDVGLAGGPGPEAAP